METTNSTMNVHLTGEGQTQGEVRMSEHQYSNGPYAVVTLNLGSFTLTVFPGENVAELAETLSRMGAELTELADAGLAAQTALALTD